VPACEVLHLLGLGASGKGPWATESDRSRTSLSRSVQESEKRGVPAATLARRRPRCTQNSHDGYWDSTGLTARCFGLKIAGIVY
jgi:hypothetical protein